MLQHYNLSLLIAGVLSAVASLLHAGIIVGGPSWYRFFGAGERFATAAEAGRSWPGLITFGIAVVLGVWALYALSAAGVLAPLPLTRMALVLITAVYLLRGLVLVPAFVLGRGKVAPFVFWSSLICLVYGAFHLVGLIQMWHRLPGHLQP